MSEPFSFLVPCGIIAAACIPLMFNVVPPNSAYGFRTRRTLGNRELWFRGNRFAGWIFFIASATSAAVFIVYPEYASGRSLVGAVVLVVPLVIALVVSLVYVQWLGARGEQ